MEPEYTWTYNSRTHLGQVTYPDGTFKIYTGKAADDMEAAEIASGGPSGDRYALQDASDEAESPL